MSHFEYVAVMISIIMGLGIIRLLSSLEMVFSRQRYWPHALWVLTMFWSHVQNWWGLWELNGLSFTVVIYSMTIVYASLMYLCAVALTNKSREEMSWKEYFFSQRRWFFGVFSITTFFAIDLLYAHYPGCATAAPLPNRAVHNPGGIDCGLFQCEGSGAQDGRDRGFSDVRIRGVFV